MPRVTVAELLHLSRAERIQLAEDLWDSVAAHPEQVEIPPEQLEELERRLAELDENSQIEEAHPSAHGEWVQELERRARDVLSGSAETEDAEVVLDRISARLRHGRR